MTNEPILRVLSYNVRSLRDDQAAVGRVIRASGAHVVCIQEAPRWVRWRAKCAALARRSGFVVVTGGATAAGNLILCDLGVEVVSVGDVLFSPVQGRHQRGAAVAALRWRGRSFVLASTHLDLESVARLRHVVELEEELAGFGSAGPAIVAGDFNDEPGSWVWARLIATRTDTFAVAGSGDGFTCSALNPARRIDAIFADAAFAVVSARVLDGVDVMRASDHRPVLVELAFPTERPG